MPLSSDNKKIKRSKHFACGKQTLRENTKYEVVNKLLMLFFVLAVNILNPKPTVYVSVPVWCFILGCIEKLVVVINCTSASGEGKQKCPSLHDGAFSVH